MYAGRIVEQADTAALFATPHHPYTRGLLSCIPSGTTRGIQLVPIPGQPPSMLRLPPGCSFAPRCPFVEDRCREALPPRARVRRRSPLRVRAAGRSCGQPDHEGRSSRPTPPPPSTPSSRSTARSCAPASWSSTSPADARACSARPPVIRAVDGVDLDDPTRRDAGSRRRVRARASRRSPGCSPACSCRPTARSSSTGGPRPPRPRAAARAAPGRAGRLPGSVRVAQPAPPRRVDHRRPARRPRQVEGDHQGARPGADGARRPQLRACSNGSGCRRRAA